MNSWLSGAEAGARERPLAGRGLLLGAIMFLNEVEVVVARLCECTKNHCTRHLNRVNFMGCELHLNFFFKKRNKVLIRATTRRRLYYTVLILKN